MHLLVESVSRPTQVWWHTQISSTAGFGRWTGWRSPVAKHTLRQLWASYLCLRVMMLSCSKPIHMAGTLEMNLNIFYVFWCFGFTLHGWVKKSYWDMSYSACCTDQDNSWMKAKKKRTVAEVSTGNGDVGQMLGLAPPQDSPVQPPELVQADGTPATVQPATAVAPVTNVQPAATVQPATPVACVTNVQPAATVQPATPVAPVTNVQPATPAPPCTPPRAYRRAPGTPVPAAQSKAAARPPPREDAMSDDESDNSLSSDVEAHVSEPAEEEPDPCPICLEKVQVGESVTALPCAHVCHNECLSKWRASRPGGIPLHHCPMRCERTWQSEMEHVPSEWELVEAQGETAMETEIEQIFGWGHLFWLRSSVQFLVSCVIGIMVWHMSWGEVICAACFCGAVGCILWSSV